MAGTPGAVPPQPPGPSPGPQSQRSGRAPVVLAVFAGICVVFVVIGFVAGSYVFAGIALVMLAVVAGSVLRARVATAEHLAVTVDQAQVRRGMPVIARLTVTAPQAIKGERVELGLVCLERHDYETHQRSSSGGSRRRRNTAEEIAHQEWHPVDHRLADAQASFTVPAAAPYSHEGKCLSYVWSVRAREVRQRGIDRQVRQPLWVLP